MIVPMDALDELDRCNFEPAVKAQVTELLLALTVELTTKDAKIAALTHELAYYKRIRFGQKTEALAGLQRDLFREEVETDLAAIEAELESLKATPRPTIANTPQCQKIVYGEVESEHQYQYYANGVLKDAQITEDNKVRKINYNESGEMV